MLSPLRFSCLTAVAVCAAGFGVMTVLWYVTPQDNSLPGHWDYISGTLGDALVLPVLAGALTYMVRLLPASLAQVTAAAAGAVLGAAGGVAVQYSWLADPAPRRNWVLPQSGVFSVAGWYHAAFLVALSATITAGYAVVLARLHKTRDEGVLLHLRPSLAVFSAAVPLFLGLVVLDSWRSAATSSSMTTIAVCLTAVVLALLPLPLAAGRVLARLLPAQVVGVLVGVGLASLVMFLRHYEEIAGVNT